jgi:hypothetical protein
MRHRIGEGCCEHGTERGILGSHGDMYEDVCFLGCRAV